MPSFILLPQCCLVFEENDKVSPNRSSVSQIGDFLSEFLCCVQGAASCREDWSWDGVMGAFILCGDNQPKVLCVHKCCAFYVLEWLCVVTAKRGNDMRPVNNMHIISSNLGEREKDFELRWTSFGRGRNPKA